MLENDSQMVLIQVNNLRSVITSVIEEEFKKFETKLERKSKILTRENAAKKLGVCPDTISEYIKDGRLTNRGLGRKILLFETDLDGVKVNRYSNYKNL